MNIIFYWEQTIENLLTAKIRSFLAILGILVGTASVVALISGGELATENALLQFKTLGTDLLTVSIDSSSGEGKSKETQKKLSVSDVNLIAKASPEILHTAAHTNAYEALSFQKTSLSGSVVGATESLQDILKVKLAQGRFISSLDKQLLYGVIGSGLYNRIKQEGFFGDIIGQQILIGNSYFTIVGVMQEWPESSFMEVDINNTVVVPLATSLVLSEYVEIRDIIFQLVPNADNDQVEASITKTVNTILPDAKLNFRSSKELIRSMDLQHRTFTWMLGFIGGISLLVGGIGVMNIMLVSVLERRREIGLRRALGACKRDIQYMFLMEGIGLTVFGGVVGVLLGIFASYLIAHFAHWQFFIMPIPPLIGFLVSVLTGIFFGFYPALQASKLNPIDALRSD